MISSESTKGVENDSTRAELPEFRQDLPSLVRQIRICRSTLGAVLEGLENADPSFVAFEKVGECSTSVTAEIERLWELVRRSE